MGLVSSSSEEDRNKKPHKTSDSLWSMVKIPAARSLMLRLMLERVSVAGFGAAMTTLIAVQPSISWLPFSNSHSISGLATLGIVSASGAVGGLLSNSLGQHWVEKSGPLFMLKVSGFMQIFFTIILSLLLFFGDIQNVGVLGLSVLTFVLALSSPGISGLARAWWEAIGLSKTHAARGGSLEPSLAAIAWSIGPVIAAPLVLLSPWVLVVFSSFIAIGLFLLSVLPNPYLSNSSVTKPSSKKVGVKFGFRIWWMAGTYSFYHIARALLSLGSSSVLVGANQQALIGAANAAPSAGHSVAGIFFAARKNPHDGLKRAVIIGLVGQAVPTALIALVFFFHSEPSIVASIILLIGGGVIIGILKAPVASAIYPLASNSRPEITTGKSASMLAQGMIIGGLVGPLLGTLIISTVGSVWLLPASVGSLIFCGIGVLCDDKIVKAAVA